MTPYFLTPEISGGIGAHIRRPKELAQNSLAKNQEKLRSAKDLGINHVVFIASSCMYPSDRDCPMNETELGDGPLEKSSKLFAQSQFATIQFAKSLEFQNLQVLIPSGVFGPQDKFMSQDAHVIPSLFRKSHFAKVKQQKSFEVWGAGQAIRDFVYSEDLTDAAALIAKKGKPNEVYNVSSQNGVSISSLAKMIGKIVGYHGNIEFQKDKPQGAQCKLLESSKLRKLGWLPKNNLQQGLIKTYQWTLEQGTWDV